MAIEPRPVELIVDADAAVVGRQVRARLDAQQRVAGFVGDADADADAIAELTADILRSSPPSAPPSSSK